MARKSRSKKPGTREEPTKKPPDGETDDPIVRLVDRAARDDFADVHDAVRELASVIGLPAKTTTDGPYTVTRLSVGEQQPVGKDPRARKPRPTK
jgi:hypothetical protein